MMMGSLIEVGGRVSGMDMTKLYGIYVFNS